MHSTNPFSDHLVIMGIVNVTPDSFSDGGYFYEPEKAIAQGIKLAEQGAKILDIGGESTRPGADPVSIEEELRRVLPVIDSLKGKVEWLSIDTRHAEVMKQAMEAGANFINDVSALEDDPESLAFVASVDVPVCLMHKKGQPKNMQDQTQYYDVVEEVYTYLKGRIELCKTAGINEDRLIIDPGIGFGKNLQQNIELLKNLSYFQNLGVPVLLGASRKTFIEKAMGVPIDPQDRLPGSLAAAMWGVQQNVQILRVHDVAETRQALAVYKRFL